MTQWLIPALAGAVTGVLSGFGVGGGTLLLIYMTAFAGVGQAAAQGINLLYFLPTAATALPSHIKNGYVVRWAALPAIAAGWWAPPWPPGGHCSGHCPSAQAVRGVPALYRRDGTVSETPEETRK